MPRFLSAWLRLVFWVLSEDWPCSYSERPVFRVSFTYADLGGYDGVYRSQSDLFLHGSRLGKAFLSVRSDRFSAVSAGLPKHYQDLWPGQTHTYI